MMDSSQNSVGHQAKKHLPQSSGFGPPRRSSARLGKTPFKRIQHRKVLSEQTAKRRKCFIEKQSILASEAFNDLMKKSWHVYSCSPLHKFKSSHASLRKMSQLLSSVLAAGTSKHRGFATDEEVGTKACFNLVNGLAISEDDSQSIKITVTTPEKKEVAELLLCSLDCGHLLNDVCNLIKSHSDLEENFTVLPLLLYRGNQSTQNIIFNWLKVEFDCNISKLTFNSMSMAWMLGMWSNICTSENQQSTTKLTWKVPLPNTGLDFIESDIQASSVETLWKACHKQTDDVVLIEEVQNFINGIQEHLFRHFAIKFHALPLHQLCLDIVNVLSTGKIKILSPNHVHTILSHLATIAVEQLNWKFETDERS